MVINLQNLTPTAPMPQYIVTSDVALVDLVVEGVAADVDPDAIAVLASEAGLVAHSGGGNVVTHAQLLSTRRRWSPRRYP